MVGEFRRSIRRGRYQRHSPGRSGPRPQWMPDTRFGGRPGPQPEPWWRHELREAVCKADWPALLDPMPWTRIPGTGKHISLMLHHGMYRGKMLEERWGRLLAAKGVRTFGDLSPGSLKLVATDITHQSGVVLPEDLRQYGIDPMGFSVARAVHMSAAVPSVYLPVRLPHRDADGEVVLMSDGG